MSLQNAVPFGVGFGIELSNESEWTLTLIEMTRSILSRHVCVPGKLMLRVSKGRWNWRLISSRKRTDARIFFSQSTFSTWNLEQLGTSWNCERLSEFILAITGFSQIRQSTAGCLGSCVVLPEDRITQLEKEKTTLMENLKRGRAACDSCTDWSDVGLFPSFLEWT